jgi:hypothetical protein
VAYLIEENENWELVLDAIALASYGVWGGRFHLIVPCQDGEPIKEFIPWLEAYDPDLIYSYVDLSEKTVQALHESIYPSYLTRHEMPRNDKITRRSFQPRHMIQQLTVETTLPFAALLARNAGGDQAPTIESYHGSASKDQFVQVNFGQFTGSTGHSFPRFLEEYSSALDILSKDELQPRARYGLQNFHPIENRLDALALMTTKRVFTVAGLSALEAPRVSISYSNWANSFSIVVGNGFIDRVTHWNARSLFPRWRDNQYVDLYIPDQDIDDINLISAISTFLTKRNFVSRDGQNSQHSATIYSSSVPIDRLEKLASQLKGEKGWNIYAVKAIHSIFDHIPNDRELEQAHLSFSDGFGARRHSEWQEDDILTNEINTKSPRPQHMQINSSALWSGHHGAWAVDMLIGRTNDLSPYANRTQDWILPRRLRLASTFKRGYELTGARSIALTRVSAGGCLCLYVDNSTDVTGVRVPSDEAAIRRALTQGRDWWPFVSKHGGTTEMPDQLALEASRSSNGRYFWGVLSMFGGLDQIKNYLLVKFWHDQFKVLGGSPSDFSTSVSQLERNLKKALRGRLTDPISGSIPAIADIALAEAEKLKFRPPIVSWTDLQAAHSVLIDHYWNEYPPRDDEKKEDSDWWREDQVASLELSLQRLCKMGVVHQGFEVKCKKCLHRNWISVDALQSTVACDVCHTIAPAPISTPWQFRLNGFLKEALRSHGILPLFWALEKRRRSSSNSFYFEGPLDLFYSDENLEKNQVDAEIDLTIISGGLVEMLEVKSSSRQMDKAIKFAELAKHLRPDIATIAIMEVKSQLIEDKFKKFAAALRDTGIEPKLMTLEQMDLSDDPSLSETYTHKIF